MSTDAQPEGTRTSSLAIVAFVLGLLSVIACLGPFTGVPAIVIGHRANREVVQSDGRVNGQALALTGLATGIVGTLIGIVAVAFMTWYFVMGITQGEGITDQ